MSTGRRWNTRWPKGHPDGGQFRPKTSQSVRVSTRSVSYNAGLRTPIVPGKLALYTGVLIRLERVSDKPSFLRRQSDKVLGSIVAKSGNSPYAIMASRILTQRTAEAGGVRISRNKIVSTPSLRVSNAPGQEARRKHRSEYKSTAVRARAPRAPRARAPRTRQPNAKAITSGRKVAA